jgi:hypothetical protein
MAGTLVLHELHQRDDLLGAPLHQQRPDELVLGLVVMVQQASHRVDVPGDQRCPRHVTGGHLADHTRREAELAPEHVVHHDHLAAVEVPLVHRHQVSLVEPVSLRAPARPAALTMPAGCGQPVNTGWTGHRPRQAARSIETS